MSLTQSGKKPHEAWNEVLVEVSGISRAHCTYVVVMCFANTLDTEVKQHYPRLYPILERLCHFFALHMIEKSIGDFLWDGYFSAEQALLVRNAVRHSLKLLRPDIVPLVDAFNFSDHSLQSALGRYDGNVYQALWESAQRDPSNAEDVDAEAYAILKPLFKASL